MGESNQQQRGSQHGQRNGKKRDSQQHQRFSPRGGGSNVAPPLHFADAIHTLLQGEITSARECDADRSLDQCELCAQQKIAYAAVGKCNHRQLMCWICAIRLRLLAIRQAETPDASDVEFHCPYDHELSPQVLLTQKLVNWESIYFDEYEKHQPTGLHFSDPKVAEAFNILLDIRCWFPECFQANRLFDSMEALKTHLLEDHNRKFCDICYRAKYPQLFLPEHVLYDPLDLPRHRRQGDNHIEPHVFCRACRQYLFDAQEMEAHWRGSDNHFCCRLCRASGMQMVIFSSYDLLWDHHVTNHFPCTYEECKQAEIVFPDSNELQLHMAKKHFESSEFYSNVGRRGVRINLSAYALAEEAAAAAAAAKKTKRGGRRPGRNQQSQNTTQSTIETTTAPSQSNELRTYTTDPVCALWPREMVAEADAVLKHMMEVPKQYPSPKACSDAMARLFNSKKAQFFHVDREWKQITSECEAMVRNNKPKPVEQALGTIARIIFSRWQWWVARVSANRMLEEPSTTEDKKTAPPDNDERPELTTPKWLSVTGELSIASEVLLVLMLAVPPELPDTQEKMLSIMRRIASYSSEARKDMSRVAPREDGDARGGTDEADSPTELLNEVPTDGGEKRVEILGKCAALPINPNVSFLEAITFALDEYIRATDAETLLRDRSKWEDKLKNCPLKVPKNILTRMKAQYRRVDLESFKNLERDLSQFISTSLLEKFKTLHPWYLLKRRQIKDAMTARKTDESNSAEYQLKLEEKSTDWSKAWGAQCDLVFNDFEAPQLLLLRHYVVEAAAMAPNACGIDEDLISGIDREFLEKAPKLVPEARTFYDTRTHTIEQSDFPELPSAVSPQTVIRPTSWAARGGRSVPHHTSTHSHARAHGGTRSHPTSSSRASKSTSQASEAGGGWGTVACRSCGVQNSRTQSSCQSCRRPLRVRTGQGIPSSVDDFPGLQSVRNPGTRY